MHSIANTNTILGARSQRWVEFITLCVPALKAHAPLFIVLGVHMACAAALFAVTPNMQAPSLWTLFLSFATFVGILIPLSLLTLRFVYLAVEVRPKHPISALARDMWDFLRQPERAANGLVIVIIFVIFMNVFSYLKGSISLIQPFSWDTTFIEWDRLIHFGQDPWKLLHPVLGYAPITFIITVSYHLWFMVMWLMVCGLAFARIPSVLRTRFFLTFMLTWSIGGNLLAIVFSSAGPCYYGLLGNSPDPFAPLISYLQTVNETLPLWAVDTQLLLWNGYQGNSINLGISAMPSMHNAAALLFALAAWQLNRKLGMALYAFTALIFLGSIHLGWHYAIDAYVGFAVTLLAWWISGIVASWWETTAWVGEYRQTLARFSETEASSQAGK